jgi:hypothetical protein
MACEPEGFLRIALRLCLVGQRHGVRETAPSPFFVVLWALMDHRQSPNASPARIYHNGFANGRVFLMKSNKAYKIAISGLLEYLPRSDCYNPFKIDKPVKKRDGDRSTALEKFER